MPPLLILLLKIVWTLLALLSATITLSLFFTNSPNQGKKPARLFYPALLLTLAALATGANLVYHLNAPWQIPVSFLLVLAPPTLIIAATRLLK